MCGRFANAETTDMLARVFAARAADDLAYEPNDDCRPTQILPIVLAAGSGARHLRPATWGLHADWSKRPLINARIETAADKPSFARLYREQRCLVPATAFHEWRDGQRLAFAMADGALFAMAGLWQLHEGRGRFIILTTAPNDLVAPVHDRMPVIVPADHHQGWLTGAALPDLARPYPAAAMALA